MRLVDHEGGQVAAGFLGPYRAGEADCTFLAFIVCVHADTDVGLLGIPFEKLPSGVVDDFALGGFLAGLDGDLTVAVAPLEGPGIGALSGEDDPDDEGVLEESHLCGLED